jgi:hypothetical protein
MPTQEEFFSGGGSIVGTTVSQDDFFDTTVADEKEAFTKRFGDDLKRRIDTAEAISDAVREGEQTFAEGVVQIAGKVGVGGFFDLIGQGLVSGFRSLPDPVEEKLRDGATKVIDSEVGQAGIAALGQGVERYQEWRDENKRAARNLEAATNIGLLFAPVKGRKAPKATERLGQRLEQSGVQALEDSKQSFVKKLVTPVENLAVRREQVGRSDVIGSGLFSRTQPRSTAAQIASETEVLRIPGISRKKTFQENFNLIDDANTKIAQKLTSDLDKSNVLIPKQEVKAMLERVRKTLGEEPQLVGDAGKQADRILARFDNFIDANEGTASGLLKARKELDQWLRSRKPKVFDAKAENAQSVAVRELRNATNDFLDSRVTNVAVKDSLKRQRNLFNALDAVRDKAANEGRNVFMRTLNKAENLLGARNKAIQLTAATLGVGGLGAAAIFAPVAAKAIGAGLVLSATGKFIMSPQLRRGVGQLINEYTRMISRTTDKGILRELRTDRAILQNLLDNGVIDNR